MTLKEKAKRTIDRYKMLSPGDGVLVGVSGGPDSMALLYLLLDIRKEYGVTLKIAHLNHGFRQEAAQEAEFVTNIASSSGLEAVLKKIDVPAIKEREGLSAQETARDVRYAFFEETARKTGSNKVALAHTADDQAETVLMRLLRGAGPLGLSGIPPVRDMSGVPGTEITGQQVTIIRPLIDCSRKEIEGYISGKNIPFVTDSSNLKMDYLRNRVRMELIPFLEGYNPNIKDTMVRTAELAGMDNQFLDMEAEKAFAICQKGTAPGFVPASAEITLAFKTLKSLHPAISARVIRKTISAVKGDLKRISFQHISNILSLIDSGEGRWSLHLPDITVSREHDRVIFKREIGRR